MLPHTFLTGLERRGDRPEEEVGREGRGERGGRTGGDRCTLAEERGKSEQRGDKMRGAERERFSYFHLHFLLWQRF